MAVEERKSDYIEKLVAVNRTAKVVKGGRQFGFTALTVVCLLYTSPSPRDRTRSRMPSSA